MKPPPIARVLETAIYVDELERSCAFYEGILGLQVMSRSDRLIALNAGESTVLLLFKRGATGEGASLPVGWIPPHDGQGETHFAFAVRVNEFDEWKSYLPDRGIEIESEIAWPRGGSSIYIRDPDGHSVELVTPGVWEVY